MNMNYNRQQWEALGRLDPFWAMTGISNWDLSAFWKTGYVQVEQLHQEMSQIGYPKQFNRVLDFGCGIGRLAPAFRTLFDEYVGVDVAESLIQKARQLHAHLPQTRFLLLQPDRIDLPDQSFDLIFSFGVFQHIPNHRSVLHTITEFVRMLRPDGLIFFNVCHYIRWRYRLQLRRRLYFLCKRFGILDYHLFYRFKLYPQSVHAISYQTLQRHLQTLSLQPLFARRSSPPDAPHQLWEYGLIKCCENISKKVS